MKAPEMDDYSEDSLIDNSSNDIGNEVCELPPVEATTIIQEEKVDSCLESIIASERECVAVNTSIIERRSRRRSSVNRRNSRDI